MRCRQEEFEARYCQTSLHNYFEMCTHHMLFSFYPFGDEQELKLSHSAEKTAGGRSYKFYMLQAEIKQKCSSNLSQLILHWITIFAWKSAPSWISTPPRKENFKWAPPSNDQMSGPSPSCLVDVNLMGRIKAI